jgi:hypothetical protein
MVEEDHHHQQHKLHGVAEPEYVTTEDDDDVAAAQRRSMGVAAEAVHHHNIEPLTILPAVLPSSCSSSSTTSVPQFTPPANPALKPTTTRTRAKVPLEKGYSQMVWLKLLRTEPDLAGSLSPLSLKCNFSLSFTVSHYIEVCSESLHLITAILTFVVNSFTRVTYDCTQLLSYLQSLWLWRFLCKRNFIDMNFHNPCI